LSPLREPGVSELADLSRLLAILEQRFPARSFQLLTQEQRRDSASLSQRVSTCSQVRATESSAGVRWRGGELHRGAEPARVPGGKDEGSVVCLGDALDDCEAEADACMVGAYAFGAALKRLRKRGSELRGELLAGVLDGEHCSVGVSSRRDPHGALVRLVVDDRVVYEVRSQLQQERV